MAADNKKSSIMTLSTNACTEGSYTYTAGCLSLKGPFILLILGLIALDLFRGPISVPNRRSLTNFSGGKRNEINLRCVKAQNFVI